MQLAIPTVTARILSPGRRIPLLCVTAAGIALAASLVLGWPPMPQGQPAGVRPPLPPLATLLPQLAALLALAAGLVSLFASPAGGGKPVQSEAPPVAVTALQTVVWELRGVLAEERAKLTSLQETQGAAAHEANVVSARLARLAEAAVEAEQRLVAGVTHADKALRQPAAVVAWAAEATQRVERCLPDLADIIRQTVAEQTEQFGPALDAAVQRLAEDTNSALSAFREAVADGTSKITGLGDTVGQVDSLLAQLPLVAATVGAAAEQGAGTLTRAAGELSAQVEALEASGRDTARAAADAVGAAAEQAARLLAEATDGLAVRAASVEAGGQEAARAAAEAMGTAAEQAALRLAEATDGLAERAAALDASGRSAEQTAAALRQDAEAMRVVAAGLADAESTAVAKVARTVDGAAERLAAVIADANAAREGSVSMADLVGRLEAAGAALADHAGSLGGAGDKLAAAVDGTAERLNSAGEALAASGDAALTRIGEAAGHVDTTIAQLRTELVPVTAAAEHAARKLAETSATLSADGAALESFGRATNQAAAALRQGTEALRAAGQDIAAAARLSMTEVAAAMQCEAQRLGAVIADADAARHGAAPMADLVQRLETAAGTLADGALRLDEAGQRVATIGDAVAGRLGSATTAVYHASESVGAALAPLPGAVAGVAAATEQMAEASAVLCADAAALDASGRDTARAADALLAAASVDRIEAAAATLAAATANADSLRQGFANLSDMPALLESAAVAVAEGARGLDAAGHRVAAAGQAVADQLAAQADRGEAAARTLPDLAAEVGSAVANLQVETAVLSSIARQIQSAGAAAAETVLDASARAEVSAASLDTAGRVIGAVADDAAARIAELTDAARFNPLLPHLDRLEQTGERLHALVAALPDEPASSGVLTALTGVSADIAASAGRMEAVFAGLPDLTHRLASAEPTLDRLGVLSLRLERAADALTAEPAPDASVAALAALSADIAEQVGRVEAALAGHDRAASAMAGSMERVREAAEAAAAVLTARAEPSGLSLAAENVPNVLAATLTGLDGVAGQTETLLRQTEALAEAVMRGRVPDLSVLLADRTPVLLAGVESTMRRLNSVATALALANDGPGKAVSAGKRAG